MERLNEDIKTEQFKQVYLLYGEEAYLKKQYRDKLTRALLGAGDAMNYSYYGGKNIPVGEVIDLAETMPFLAERRVIVMEGSGFLKTASNDLADYVKGLDGSTYFVFVEDEIDKRNRLYKAIKEKGCIVELARQKEETLVRWVAGNVKREGKQISMATIHHFLEKVGLDMANISQEMEKLFSYTLHKEQIVANDIDAICTEQLDNRIFAMLDAVAEKNQRKALDFYYDLLALKEKPMKILNLLSRQFKILLDVKDLSRKGYRSEQIASQVGVPPFAVTKYQRQAKLFKQTELCEILETSADMEERVKTGRLTDMLAVELFIIQYSATK